MDRMNAYSYVLNKINVVKTLLYHLYVSLMWLNLYCIICMLVLTLFCYGSKFDNFWKEM
jgi:hypothetical protein